MKIKKLIAVITVILMLSCIAPRVYAKEKYKNGDIIRFGSYPQTQVTDEKLIEKLNGLDLEWKNYDYFDGECDVLCDEDGNYFYYEEDEEYYYFYKPNGVLDHKIKKQENDHFYDYISSGEKKDCGMKYADVEFEGQKYRGVFFSLYRNGTFLFIQAALSNKNQYVNGYTAGTTYWFKYDDIEWIVLDAERGLLLCKDIIDSQPYILAGGQYENWWKKSSIRKWLNESFYNVSFNENEKNAITESELKTVDYGFYGMVGYHFDDDGNTIPYHSVVYTKDKVFLPAISGSYKSDDGKTIYTDVDDFPIPDISVRDENGKIIGDDTYGFTAGSVENCDDVLTLTNNNYYRTEDGIGHNNYIIGNAMAKGSDYAKSQGLKVYKAPADENEWKEWEIEYYLDLPQYDGYSYWFVRNTGDIGCAYKVTQFGLTMGREFTSNVNTTTEYGIRPALCIDFDKYDALNSEMLYGDLNGDGEITAADARLALRASVGLEELTPEQKKAADVDGNGEITAADARIILRASVGLEELTNRQE